MEIKTKILLIFFPLTLFILAGASTLMGFFYSPIDTDDGHSIRQIAYKAKIKSGPSITEQLRGRSISQVTEVSNDGTVNNAEDLHFTKESFEAKNAIFLEKLNLPQSELAGIMNELSIEHDHLIKIAEKNNFALGSVDRLKPKMRIYLAYILGIDPSSMSSTDLDGLKYSGETWHYISTFVNSNDFNLLLAQDRIRGDVLKFEDLYKTYQTNDNIKNRKRFMASIKE